MLNHGRSRDYVKKVRTKSGIIEQKSNDSEDEEVIKLKDIMEKLDKEVKNQTIKVNAKAVSKFTILGNNIDNNVNKSSFLRRTTSRGREEKYDREFLLNVMKDDHIPILPRYLHLLTDNDSNLPLEEKNKYKKLANLMIEDSESVVEKCFKRDIKEKIELFLFDCFSRKSKDVFLDENHFEQAKNRLLLRKLNDINFPKLEITDSIENNNDLKNNILQNTTQNMNNHKNKYFRKKTKKIFNLPALIKIENINENIPIEIMKKKPLLKERSASVRMIKGKNKNKINQAKKNENSKEKENSDKKERHTEHLTPRLSAINSFVINDKNNNKNFWDPEIDADILCFINHNIISIEDIYNNNIKNENLEEKDIKPIMAKEIFNEEDSDDIIQLRHTYRSKHSDENEDSSDEKSKHNHNHNHNKFSDFYDYCPKNAYVFYKKDKVKNESLQFNDDLKKFYKDKMKKIWEYDDTVFPKNGINLKNEILCRYIKNNENNEKSTVDSFSLIGEPKAKKSENNTNINVNVNKNKNLSEKFLNLKNLKFNEIEKSPIENVSEDKTIKNTKKNLDSISEDGLDEEKSKDFSKALSKIMQLKDQNSEEPSLEKESIVKSLRLLNKSNSSSLDFNNSSENNKKIEK